jgi:hypothetical protein
MWNCLCVCLLIFFFMLILHTLLFHKETDYMKHSPRQEAKIYVYIWNVLPLQDLKVYYCCYKTLSLAPILSQMNSPPSIQVTWSFYMHFLSLPTSCVSCQILHLWLVVYKCEEWAVSCNAKLICDGMVIKILILLNMFRTLYAQWTVFLFVTFIFLLI